MFEFYAASSICRLNVFTSMNAKVVDKHSSSEFREAISDMYSPNFNS